MTTTPRFVQSVIDALTPPARHTCPVCGRTHAREIDLDWHISFNHPDPADSFGNGHSDDYRHAADCKGSCCS